MNFFEQQDRARKNSGYLLLLMALAVLSLIAATTALVAGMLHFLGDHAQNMNYREALGEGSNTALMNWELFATIAFGVAIVIALGSLYKIAQLSGGGRAVAESMGGRLLNINTRDADEKKLLNVVEEMAIASGTPVPPVYLMEDTSINAFAAGYKPQDAVIGVTRGCIKQLNREQLQGVIAHEFSHILHGDMKINLRLVGVLNGILIIGLLGEMLLHGARGNRKEGAAIAGAGIALLILGYAGTFFGNLIKAAVSRQREFLADASAVQYTRNPDGISGALKAIGGYSGGTQLHHNNASEFSHMYFCQGISTAFNALMATHPPLPERIRRIDPNWDGEFLPEHTPNNTTTATGSEAISQFGGVNTAADIPPPPTQQPLENSLEACIGNPSQRHIARARQLIDAMPAELQQAAHDPFSSRALIYGLLLDDDENIASQQRNLLKGQAHPATFRHFEALAAEVKRLPEETHLPLIELALPALKQQSPSQYQVFKKAVLAMIKADQKVSLKEWALYRILTHNLEPDTEPYRGTLTISSCTEQCNTLLAALAIAGHDETKAQQHALQQAASKLGIALEMPSRHPKLSELDNALNTLRRLKPLQKPALLKALMACIHADGEISTAEAELFRAIADGLDCPVPPLL